MMEFSHIDGFKKSCRAIKGKLTPNMSIYDTESEFLCKVETKDIDTDIRLIPSPALPKIAILTKVKLSKKLYGLPTAQSSVIKLFNVEEIAAIPTPLGSAQEMEITAKNGRATITESGLDEMEVQ